MERLTEQEPWAVDLYRRDNAPATRANLRLFSRGAPLPLSQRVPLLENLGFRVVNERTYRITPGGESPGHVWLHDMTLERASGDVIDLAATHQPLQETLLALFRGAADSDGFNHLVLEAGLPWRDVAMLRALGRYLRQIQVPYGQEYLAATLARHPRIAARIVALFRSRFDPRAGGRGACGTRDRAPRRASSRCSASVSSLDDDRILRRFVNLVEAAVRTNFFQTGADGAPRETITFKFLCAQVEALPLPRPMFEIFVYCPRVEGLHLRFGKVARGGIRWSDRPQDYRTEVLGLVKAQQVKNVVIVPVGAKGGFVPAHLPPAIRPPGLDERGHRELSHLHPQPARTDRQRDRREGRAAARDRAARSRRSLSGRCRRQGHRDLLRRRQRAFPPRWASGSATPSPPAAATATTTRKWALPRAARGKR